jgi:L-asparaginase II
VLKGRTITGTHHQDHRLILTFADGSTMPVHTAGSPMSPATGGTIAKVRQQGTQLALDCEDGTTRLIPLAEATASVMVRDQHRRLEYTD